MGQGKPLPIGQLFQQGEQIPASGRVQAVGRFIQSQNARPGEAGRSDKHAPQLSLGHGFQVEVQQMVQAELASQVAGQGAVLRFHGPVNARRAIQAAEQQLFPGKFTGVVRIPSLGLR